LDDAYTGGILHDLGQIIFTSLHPKMLDRIQNFCKLKGIPSGMFERLSSGMNHAEVGARIAEKWNFPRQLVSAIRCHHEPNACEGDLRELVYTVYLANAVCNLEEAKIVFDQIEPDVLKDFGISDENHLSMIRERLRQAFEQNLSKY
jgi:HD-like signal output (HDOD) protein